MPLKFKIYYACAMYLLLWGSCFLMWMFYQSAVSGLGTEAGVIITIFLVVTLATATGVMGIRAIKHYKEATLLSKTEKRVFITTYCFIILFAIGISLLLGIIIIPEELRRRSYTGYMGRMNIEDLMLTSGVFIAGVTAIYVAATGLLLLKAIQLKQRENLMSFEIEINPGN